MPKSATVAAAEAALDTPIIDKEQHKRNLKNVQDALVAEFHTLIADSERLLKQTSDVASTGAAELRVKINDNIVRAKELLKESETTVREQGRVAIDATEEYVQSNPWQSLGIAAGVGFLLGLIASRR